MGSQEYRLLPQLKTFMEKKQSESRQVIDTSSNHFGKNSISKIDIVGSSPTKAYLDT